MDNAEIISKDTAMRQLEIGNLRHVSRTLATNQGIVPRSFSVRSGAKRRVSLAKCAGDESLRTEVESLLSSLEEDEGFIEVPAGDLAAELLGTHRATYEPGHQIQNYRIERQIGSGGMGEVYLAEDTKLNRKVALKLLPPHFTVNPDRVRRFKREARAASALNHPNIITIHEIGLSDATHFIATEFVDGKTLRQLINEKPLTLNETLNLSMQVAEAPNGAHAAGIVHRDIKPENIMIRQRRLRKNPGLRSRETDGAADDRFRSRNAYAAANESRPGNGHRPVHVA